MSKLARLASDMSFSCHGSDAQMTPLYAAVGAMPFRFTETNRGLQQRLLEYIAVIHDPTKSNDVHFRLYQHVVGPFLASVSPSLGAMVRESNRTE